MNLTSLYVIGIILITYVLFESVLFYKKAYEKGLELGITKRQLMESTRFSLIFSLVPSIPILIGLVTMIPLFGDVIVPWIRLSVVGSVSYETYAALDHDCIHHEWGSHLTFFSIVHIKTN